MLQSVLTYLADGVKKKKKIEHDSAFFWQSSDTVRFPAGSGMKPAPPSLRAVTPPGGGRNNCRATGQKLVFFTVLLPKVCFSKLIRQ